MAVKLPVKILFDCVAFAESSILSRGKHATLFSLVCFLSLQHVW
jgi:hypothetical protein